MFAELKKAFTCRIPQCAMASLCCWRKRAPSEEIEENLRESKMSLRATHTNRLPSLGYALELILLIAAPPCLSRPCHLDLDPPQSMCSYRSAERLAPPPLFSATNHALTLAEGQVSHSNSMELIRYQSEL